jgi:subtilisin family serine protease
MGYIAAVLALLAMALPAAASAAGKRRDADHRGNYIVVLKSSAGDAGEATSKLERKHGIRSKLRFRRALKGFSVHLSDAKRARVEADPAVAYVSPDRPVKASATLASGETAPASVRRIGAATATTARDAARVNVAVIDTGVDLAHPDLNVAGGTNCITPGSSAQDDNGHGTHVAGSIGARNNGSGVVGVAPGTKLYAAKVLDAGGNGYTSQVICGIDWVTGTRTDADPSNDIAVANMSLGGPGAPIQSCSTTTDPEHRAICSATAAGVTFVVAAGNEGWDFDYAPQPDTPAAYPEVLTVAAMSDSDGKPGAAGGAPTCDAGEADDRYASYSNFAATAAGQAHTIAAPGTCVTSTRLGGGTEAMSGTSMAAPHIAGATALCIGEGTASGPCAGLTPANVVQKMRSAAQAHNTATGNSGYGFAGDPLRPFSGVYFGYLANAAAPPPPVVTVTAAPSAATRYVGALRSGTHTSLAATDASYLAYNSTTSGTRATDWYGTFSGVPSTLKNLKVTYRGKNSVSCSQQLSIWNYSSKVYTVLDTRSVGATEVQLDRLPGGAASNYVGADGKLYVRVRCTTASTSFYTSANLLRITYEK